MTIIYLVFGLFEEVGWRGYLVPRVAGWLYNSRKSNNSVPAAARSSVATR